MFVSIVIPTYNEAADISATLDSLLALENDDFEALIVDASSDATPEIVRRYPADKFRLIPQSRRRGRAAARNEGILLARGEIVIILNADVRLPPDFIGRILPHYANGAGYVLVESRVANVEYAPPRYIQALHEMHYPARPEIEEKMNWTEGFSCRREAALAVGLIPEGSKITLIAGEDGWFGERLAAAGYKKVFDRAIVVTHVMPPDLVGFWNQRVGRGQGLPAVWLERDHWSVGKIVRTAVMLCLLSGLALVAPFSHLWRARHLCFHSPRGHADWLTFAALSWIESAANITGLLRGAYEVWQGEST